MFIHFYGINNGVHTNSIVAGLYTKYIPTGRNARARLWSRIWRDRGIPSYVGIFEKQNKNNNKSLRHDNLTVGREHETRLPAVAAVRSSYMTTVNGFYSQSHVHWKCTHVIYISSCVLSVLHIRITSATYLSNAMIVQRAYQRPISASVWARLVTWPPVSSPFVSSM